MITANYTPRWLSAISYPTHARGIIVKYIAVLVLYSDIPFKMSLQIFAILKILIYFLKSIVTTISSFLAITELNTRYNDHPLFIAQ